MKSMLFSILMLFLLVACEKDTLAPIEDDPDFMTAVEFRDADAAIARVEGLIAQVEDMMANGTIGNGPGNSILSKLRSIKEKLERGQIDVALSKLDALLAHLDELVEEGTIDAEIADGLASEVESIDCEADPECEPVELLEVTVNTGSETYTLYVHPYDQRTGLNGTTNVNGVAWDPFPYDGDINDVNFPSCGDLPNYSSTSTLTDFDGEANTDKIVCALGDQGGTAYAAKVCADLNGEAGLGYEDWYLPSLGELKAIYEQLFVEQGGQWYPVEQRNLVNNFNGAYYWSSTEHHAYFAWYQPFDYGSQVSYFKGYDTPSCRCVRR